MNLIRVLQLIIQILAMVKDSDGDGRADIFDSAPDDPNIK